MNKKNILIVILSIIAIGLIIFNLIQSKEEIVTKDISDPIIPEEQIVKDSDEYFLSLYNDQLFEEATELEANVVTKGDINSDGLEDAIVHVWVCYQSCFWFYDFILQNPTSEPTFLEKGERYGSLIIGDTYAQTSIEEIKIIDGKVIFTGYGFGEDRWNDIDELELETHEFNVVNGVLN